FTPICQRLKPDDPRSLLVVSPTQNSVSRHHDPGRDSSKLTWDAGGAITVVAHKLGLDLDLNVSIS
ncbi:MAG: hypothetical protein ACUVT2_05915, partial [Thiobacillaceae bacterium]